MNDQTISLVTYDQSELEKVNVSRNTPVQYNFKKFEVNKTITNPSFACSLNDKEINESANEEVVFAFSNGSIKNDLKTVIVSCPALTKYIFQVKAPKSKITINLPQWITRAALMDYFSYLKTNILGDSSYKNLYILLRLADVFENYTFLGTITKTKIIPTLSYDSAIFFFQESFQKIDHNNLNFNWYELFSATKEFISINLVQYIKKDHQKLISIQKSLLEEIIEYHLLLYSKMEQEVLQFLLSLRQCEDIFELISSDFLIASSEENYAYMLNSTYSFLQCDIKELGSFYQEIPKKYNKTLDVIFYIFYKESEDLFKINFKVKNEPHPRLYSFSFVCFFDEGQSDKKYSTIKTISSLKGCSNIIQISKFRSKRSKKLNIHLKLNPIHTYTLQYLTNNLQSCYDDPGIAKVSAGLLQSVFQIAQANGVAEDILVKAMSIWLNDEININDDLNKELIRMIDWKKVNRIDMYAFLVKYTGLMDKSFEGSSLLEQLKIEKELLIGLKQADLAKLLIENIDLRKSIEAIKTKKDSPENNKEISEIKRTDNNNLFNESEEGEVKFYLQSNTIETKESLISSKSKANDKPSDASLKKETTTSEKPLRSSYEPMRTIQIEISTPNTIENDKLSSFSPQTQLSPIKQKLGQIKKQRKGRLFRNIVSKMESCSLNNNNIQKTKETSNSSQKTTNTIKSEKNCSIFETYSNNIQKVTKKISDTNKKDITSPFGQVKQKKIISTRKSNPHYKGINTIND